MPNNGHAFRRNRCYNDPKMRRFEDHLMQVLKESARDRRMVAYHHACQEPSQYCVGWFLRLEGDMVRFLDVPECVFGGEEVLISLSQLEWIQLDTPYLRGLEQLWMGGEILDTTVDGQTYRETEYIETVLLEAEKSAEVLELNLEGEGCLLAQVLFADESTVAFQEIHEDDASVQGTRCCRLAQLGSVVRNSSRCQKTEVLLGLPRASGSLHAP